MDLVPFQSFRVLQGLPLKINYRTQLREVFASKTDTFTGVFNGIHNRYFTYRSCPSQVPKSSGTSGSDGSFK